MVYVPLHPDIEAFLSAYDMISFYKPYWSERRTIISKAMARLPKAARAIVSGPYQPWAYYVSTVALMTDEQREGWPRPEYGKMDSLPMVARAVEKRIRPVREWRARIKPTQTRTVDDRVLDRHQAVLHAAIKAVLPRAYGASGGCDIEWRATRRLIVNEPVDLPTADLTKKTEFHLCGRRAKWGKRVNVADLKLFLSRTLWRDLRWAGLDSPAPGGALILGLDDVQRVSDECTVSTVIVAIPGKGISLRVEQRTMLAWSYAGETEVEYRHYCRSRILFMRLPPRLAKLKAACEQAREEAVGQGCSTLLTM